MLAAYKTKGYGTNLQKHKNKYLLHLEVCFNVLGGICFFASIHHGKHTVRKIHISIKNYHKSSCVEKLTVADLCRHQGQRQNQPIKLDEPQELHFDTDPRKTILSESRSFVFNLSAIQPSTPTIGGSCQSARSETAIFRIALFNRR